MKHTYPNLIIDRPAPGHYVIYGHKPQPVDTDEGRVVPLDQCYITDGIPSELLMDIVKERGDLAGLIASPIGDNGPSGITGAIGHRGDIGASGPDGADVAPFDAIDSGDSSSGPAVELPDDQKNFIFNTVRESGKIRIKELASLSSCTVEDIKALDGLTLGHAGWVSLSEEGAE